MQNIVYVPYMGSNCSNQIETDQSHQLYKLCYTHRLYTVTISWNVSLKDFNAAGVAAGCFVRNSPHYDDAGLCRKRDSKAVRSLALHPTSNSPRVIVGVISIDI